MTQEEQGKPLLDWIGSFSADNVVMNIPEGKAKSNGANHIFIPNGVEFYKGKRVMHREEYASIEHAASVATLANFGNLGEIEVPADESDCVKCRTEIVRRLGEAQTRFSEFAASRTASENLRDEIAALLLHWFVHGKSSS